MSFLKITDPIKREQTVKEFLEIKKNIRANELAEKTGKIELREDLSKFFEPVTETQKETQRTSTSGLRPIKKALKPIKGLKDIKTAIEKLPRKRGPFLEEETIRKKEPFILPEEDSPNWIFKLNRDDFDTEFGVYKMGNNLYIGDTIVDIYKVQESGDLFITIGDKDYLLTEGLYYLLALKVSLGQKINANDISIYRKILKETDTMYVNNNKKTKTLKLRDDPDFTETDKWQFYIKPAWDELQKELKTGKGVKKVVIPSDPNALLEKFDLLMASKAAGNMGVRNELVSMCDELKRQGIFDSDIYKKIMSLL